DPAKSDAELGFTNAVVYTASTTNQTYTLTIGGKADNGRYIRFAGDVPEKLNGWTYLVNNSDAGDFIIPRSKLVKEKSLSAEDEIKPEEQKES
ncbi:MAG: hypothetical protein OES84_04085, partial [Kiritimatiellaceae bacterium]|nr:hypothetical protein [Kiritimatiellaceae bacterium]